MLTKRRSAFLVCAMFLSTAIPAAMGADAFYEQRLNSGKAALIAKRPVDAVDQLRIAAFGLLDDPRLLVQDLALLAVAQNQLERSSDVETTLNRFVDAESRFSVYDPAVLDRDTRAQFETLLVRVVPKTTLAGIKSLARLTSGSAPPPSPNAANTDLHGSPERVTPRPVASSPSQSTSRPSNASAVVASATSADALAKARLLLKNNKADEAAAILAEAAKNDPDQREVRLDLLQAATMSSNWPLATAQLAHLRPFADSEAVYMFYAAVVLYETHNESDARDLMQRAIPHIVRSPYVDYYAKKLNVKLPT